MCRIAPCALPLLGPARTPAKITGRVRESRSLTTCSCSCVPREKLLVQSGGVRVRVGHKNMASHEAHLGCSSAITVPQLGEEYRDETRYWARDDARSDSKSSLHRRRWSGPAPRARHSPGRSERSSLARDAVHERRDALLHALPADVRRGKAVHAMNASLHSCPAAPQRPLLASEPGGLNARKQGVEPTAPGR